MFGPTRKQKTGIPWAGRDREEGQNKRSDDKENNLQKEVAIIFRARKARQETLAVE